MEKITDNLKDLNIEENINSHKDTVEIEIKSVCELKANSKLKKIHNVNKIKKNYNKSFFDSIFNMKDSSSFSNTHEILQKHFLIDIKFELMDSFQYEGRICINFDVLSDSIERIILDNNGLKVKDLKLYVNGEKYSPEYDLITNEIYPTLGNPLVIYLDTKISSSDKVKVEIIYNALQSNNGMWFYIKAKDTANKKHPIGYILNECIGARSCFPCQDTPSAKVTFEAELEVDQPLTAFASGISSKQSQSNNCKTKYFYNQEVVVPTYLIVFAVGEFETIEISPRMKAYCEAPLVSKVTTKYKEILEKYLTIAENLLTPYEWKEFNVLVIPKFKYQGMENPQLVFIDSKSIDSDSLMIHEMTHSWFGNLITNINWENFWINEGITTFFQEKMIKEIFGQEHYENMVNEFDSSLNSLIDYVGENSSLSSLHPDYEHTDPLKSYTMLPYYKGSHFMRFLEKLVGEENMMKFLRHIISEFKFKCLDYNDLKSSFEKFIVNEMPDKGPEMLIDINWEKWILKPGYPPY